MEDIIFLEKIKKNLMEVVGLLDQANFQGQKNIFILYNCFGNLNQTLGDITEELDKAKLNNEKPGIIKSS